jgi:hypothetical protein
MWRILSMLIIENTKSGVIKMYDFRHQWCESREIFLRMNLCSLSNGEDHDTPTNEWCLLSSYRRCMCMIHVTNNDKPCQPMGGGDVVSTLFDLNHGLLAGMRRNRNLLFNWKLTTFSSNISDCMATILLILIAMTSRVFECVPLVR